MLGSTDSQLRRVLVLMPGGVGRERQQQLVRSLITWIADAATAAREAPGDLMLNALVEIDDSGECSRQDVPSR
jgi:hypothetical protein